MNPSPTPPTNKAPCRPCQERAKEGLRKVESGEAGPVLRAALSVPAVRRHFERTAAGQPILSRRQREQQQENER